MLKKIALFVLILFPFGVFAQEMKIAYFNSEEILPIMPETVAAKSTLEKMEQSLQSELKLLDDEFTKKYTAFQQQADTLVESIKTRRLQDLQDIRQRAENFQKDSYQKMQDEQKKLYDPIMQKIRDAIKVVGDEAGYSYIVQADMFLYISSSSAVNATPLIKKKLNLQ